MITDRSPARGPPAGPTDNHFGRHNVRLGTVDVLIPQDVWDEITS